MGVGFQLLERAGRLITHGLGILLLAWRRVVRAMLIGGLVGVVLTEIVAAILTHQVPPAIPAHVAALVFGVALAYAAGLTVLADELLRGAIDTVRLLEGDVEAGARAAAIVAEREVGEIRLGLARRRAARDATPRPTRASRPGDVPNQYDAAMETSAETLDAIAATDEFTSTAPRPRVNARPVRADQLPRIPWAYDQRADDSTRAETEETTPTEAAPAIAVPDVDPLPPLPLKPAPAPEIERAASASTAGIAASAMPFIVTPASDTFASDTPVAMVPNAESPDPAVRMVPVTSQPRAAASTQPADSTVPPAEAAEPRGVWSRISQALIGNALVEPSAWSDPSAGGGSASSEAPPASTDDPPAE